MDYEVERKFRLRDAKRLVTRVEQLGGTFGAEEYQCDSYFAHPSRDFSETDEALRIRAIGDRRWVTYKGPKVDHETKTRRELEIALPDADGDDGPFADLLTAVGFQPVRQVRKRRRRAHLPSANWQFEIALDNVDGLGLFVELETIADASHLDAARAAMAELAEQLGVCDEIRRSYLEMVIEADTRI